MLSPEYDMPGKQKESIMCDLDLGNEVYYHRFAVSTTRILTDLILPSEIQARAFFGSHTCYLHLTLV